jgi:hypothetical protein
MAKNPATDAPLQTTKQMLDELDAMMERMLALPVHELDSAPALPKTPPLAPEESALTNAPTNQAEVETLPPPQPSAPPRKSKLADLLSELKTKPREEISPGHAATNPPHLKLPAESPVSLSSMPPPPPLPEMLTNSPVPPTLLGKLEPLLATIPDARPPRTRRWLYGPLVGINHLFDRVTSGMGGVGYLLSSAGGRTILGLSGIALLLASAGWLVRDWMGWH